MPDGTTYLAPGRFGRKPNVIAGAVVLVGVGERGEEQVAPAGRHVVEQRVEPLPPECAMAPSRARNDASRSGCLTRRVGYHYGPTLRARRSEGASFAHSGERAD